MRNGCDDVHRSLSESHRKQMRRKHDTTGETPALRAAQTFGLSEAARFLPGVCARGTALRTRPTSVAKAFLPACLHLSNFRPELSHHMLCGPCFVTLTAAAAVHGLWDRSVDALRGSVSLECKAVSVFLIIVFSAAGRAPGA